MIHPSGVPAGFHTTPTNMPNATLVVAAAADGYPLKSVVLWPCHKLPKEMRVLLSAFIDVWDNNDGWMTESIFQRYAEEVLLTGIIERRKILMKTNERCLLLLDSHSSRAQPDIWQKFADNNIDVVTFIPHSSHITQPLDCGVFAVFKKCINSLYSVPPNSSISLQCSSTSSSDCTASSNCCFLVQEKRRAFKRVAFSTINTSKGTFSDTEKENK